MGTRIAILSSIFALVATGCSKGEGEDYAKKLAEENKDRTYEGKGAVAMKPPVPPGNRIACTDLLDPTAFTATLEEEEEVVMKDESARNGDATAECAIIRGGEPPSKEAQAKLIERKGRVGVIAGDELCVISLFCWQFNEADKFKERCERLGNQDSEELGVYSCMQITQRGADDAYSHEFIDADTKCVIGARGGPSMNDHEVVKKCATLAMGQIGPEQIAKHAKPE